MPEVLLFFRRCSQRTVGMAAAKIMTRQTVAATMNKPIKSIIKPGILMPVYPENVTP